jgi:hypothetical protein
VPVTPADFLLGVVLPALAAALVLLAARRVSGGPDAGAALAVGGAYVLAHLLQRGWRGFPPREATDWPWVAAAGGALLGATALTRRGPEALRVALRLLAAAALLWLALGSWRARVDASEAHATIAAAAVAVAVVWSVAERRSAAPTWLVPATLALTAAGAAAAIGMSGSAKLALLAGALCAVLSAAALGAGLALAPPALSGAVAPGVLALAALTACATFYSDLPAGAAGLLALAPCAVLLPAAALGERARRPALAGLLLFAAALLALAVKLALDASPRWDE